MALISELLDGHAKRTDMCHPSQSVLCMCVVYVCCVCVSCVGVVSRGCVCFVCVVSLIIFFILCSAVSGLFSSVRAS